MFIDRLVNSFHSNNLETKVCRWAEVYIRLVIFGSLLYTSKVNNRTIFLGESYQNEKEYQDFLLFEMEWYTFLTSSGKMCGIYKFYYKLNNGIH